MKNLRKIVHLKNTKKLIIITGQQRSGKTTLTRLVSSFEGPVNIRIEFFLDSLMSLQRLKLISKEALGEIIEMYLHNLIIDNQYGRNLNFRKNEDSSVWNSSNPNFFLKKINKKFTKKEIKRNLLKRDNNELVIVLHNIIELIKFFPDKNYKINIVNIYSHPIDQIYSMYMSKSNSKFDNLTREPIYKYKNNKYCLTVGYENKLKNLNLMQKILIIKKNSDDIELKNKKILKKNFKVINIYYDDILLNPLKTIKKVSEFIKKKPSHITHKTIKKNNEKKKFINLELREKRLKFINKRLKLKKYKLMLKEIVEVFEKKYV